MAVNRSLARTIRARAGDQCEYCKLPQALYYLPFHVDHIVAEKHGGAAIDSNLALACPHCNRCKGPNLAGFDTVAGQVVRLFHPRLDIWADHFAWDGAHLVGLSPIGRVTVQVLAINAEDFLQLRIRLLNEGVFPY